MINFLKSLNGHGQPTDEVKLLNSHQFQECLQLANKDETLQGRIVVAQANYRLGNFQASQNAIAQARNLLENFPENERAMCERVLTALNNKAKIELTGLTSVGNINDAAILPKPPVEEVKEITKQLCELDPKYDWYQNMTHVFVTWKIKKGDIRNTVEVEFGQEFMTITDQGTQIAGLNYSNRIVAHQSTFNCTLKKLEIRLKKDQENVNWPSLEKNAGQPIGQVVAAPKLQSGPLQYPSSSKNKKNWDKVEQEASKELTSEKPEGDSALNDLFKQIYGRADEATRRAMIKSYQTSGGTVLSTNWDEVASKDYEGQDRPEAPAGQKWVKD